MEGSQEAVACATAVLEQLQLLAHRHDALTDDDVTRVLAGVRNGDLSADSPPLEVYKAGRQIRARTAGQSRYLEAIQKHDVVLCCGPAGTGKTYLAVATAVAALKQAAVRKIVLVRPAVEAGESLGFLPGDLQAKINPYLRPLLDALREMMDHDLIKRYTEEDVIEVIPLAYMRGRTLNEAFIILDEAQNTTVAQMKMFLTRMGNGSKIVVSGDITQVDLAVVARDDHLRAVAHARQEHQHLRSRGVLGLVQDDHRIVERPAPHERQRDDLDQVVDHEPPDLVVVHHIMQRVEQRA
jgi:phosphate starvation-inducible protein PhoH and related proteins